MLEGRYEPEGKLVQHLKDVDLMLEVGHAVGAPLLATAVHRQLLLAGVAAGWSERDNSSIMAVLRSLIGIQNAMTMAAGKPATVAQTIEPWSERDNSSIMAVLHSRIELPGTPRDTAGPP